MLFFLASIEVEARACFGITAVTLAIDESMSISILTQTLDLNIPGHAHMSKPIAYSPADTCCNISLQISDKYLG